MDSLGCGILQTTLVLKVLVIGLWSELRSRLDSIDVVYFEYCFGYRKSNKSVIFLRREGPGISHLATQCECTWSRVHLFNHS